MKFCFMASLFLILFCSIFFLVLFLYPRLSFPSFPKVLLTLSSLSPLSVLKKNVSMARRLGVFITIFLFFFHRFFLDAILSHLPIYLSSHIHHTPSKHITLAYHHSDCLSLPPSPSPSLSHTHTHTKHERV